MSWEDIYGRIETTGLLLVLLAWVAINLLIGYAIGNARGRIGAGMMLGLFLGPIGWLLVILGPDRREHCRFCAEPVKPEAIVCPHCQRSLIEPRKTFVADPVEEWAKSQKN